MLRVEKKTFYFLFLVLEKGSLLEDTIVFAVPLVLLSVGASFAASSGGAAPSAAEELGAGVAAEGEVGLFALVEEDDPEAEADLEDFLEDLVEDAASSAGSGGGGDGGSLLRASSGSS